MTKEEKELYEYMKRLYRSNYIDYCNFINFSLKFNFETCRIYYLGAIGELEFCLEIKPKDLLIAASKYEKVKNFQ